MKVAVITGASSGLGKEFALQIAQKYKGLDEIWLIARREDRLVELKNSIKNVTCRVIPLDLSAEVSFEIYEQLLEELKPQICLLINCAGFGKIGSFEASDFSDQVGMIDLNIKALVWFTYASLPYLYKKSRIIQVASAASFLPQPNFSVYAATKSFVVSFSRSLHYELKDRNIKVLAVCPGPVKTEFFDVALNNGEPSQLLKKLSMAKADKVVRKALIDLSKGKEVSCYGLMINIFRVMAKILPHRWILPYLKY
jgi:hypothetical protein